MKTISLRIDITTDDQVDPVDLADHLMDYLCIGYDTPEVDYPTEVESIDAISPLRTPD